MGSDPKNIHRVEEFLLKMNSAFKIDDEKFGSLLVVVTEAVNNAIIHGNKRNPVEESRCVMHTPGECSGDQS